MDKRAGMPLIGIAGKGSESPFLDTLRLQSFCNFDMDSGTCP
ncbi:hypothetical protein A2U01_0094312, partial [Trifolium medium]|nr:hypothetical protein [Trifolium medium]